MRINRWQQGWRGQTLAIIAGGVAVFAFSPFDLWPFAPLSSALLFYLLLPLSPRQAAWRGTAYGLGLYGAGTSWIYVSIHEFGAASAPLAAMLTLLFCIAMALLFITSFSWLYTRLRQRLSLSPTLTIIVFSALWVLFEWLRSWLFTGFPWLLMGYSLLDTPFSGWAPVTGVFGLSLISVMAGAILGQFCHQRRFKGSLAGLAVIYSAILTCSFFLTNKAWTQPASQPISVAAVQPNIPQQLKWREGYLQTTLERLQTLTSAHWQTDIIVWPENAIPALHHRSQGYLRRLAEQAETTRSTLITGIPFYEEPADIESGAFYNGITSIGLGQGNYYKQKLVPFGEYVPLQSILRGVIQLFDLPMSNFARGPENQPLLSANGYQIAPLICYEVVYPDLVAQMSQQADILLTVSNDTWFGKSIGPHQHFQMARMRALENGRYLIRATNDGITAFVDPFGKVITRLPQFESGVLSASIYAMNGHTPFTRTGSIPIVLFAIAGLLLSVITARRKPAEPKA